MKQIGIIFLYTLKEGVRKKAFLISTLIILALLLALCLAPRVISIFSGDKDKTENAAEQSTDGSAGAESTKVCYVIDKSGLLKEDVSSLQAVYTDRRFELADAGQEDALKKEVKEKEDNSLIVIEEQNGLPFIRVINSNFMKGISADKIAEVCTSVWQNEILTGSGVDETTISLLQQKIPYASETVGEMNLTGYILGIVMVMVMFFAVYYYGYGVSMSIASEKTSRVMETLVISAKPSRILIGKCLGMGVLGLGQLLFLLLFGVICYTALVPHNFAVSGVTLDFSHFTLTTILLLIGYFVLGYALYAVLNSVCGAAVSKVEDLNSAMMPVTVLSMAGFYLGYFTSIAGGGSSALSKAAIYLPISSPFAVPFKLLTGGIETRDIAISIGLLVISIVVVAVISIRVYSASVLHYGNKLKMKELLRMR